MEIMYPPLVEQGFRFFSKLNPDLTKADTYSFLVKNMIITPWGYPTDKALQAGWVKEINEEQDLSFPQFLAIYPVFAKFKQSFFKKIDGFWEIKMSLKNQLLWQLKQSFFDEDEEEQLQEYFSTRKIID
ncbi:hypothetical protein [Liquorilactobacillus oeni]|uniref:Uncharacterized protein n=1 Tax=Liquorilactobacillus oeni DSM 19972 TaxID=1423777 RepID=A0A0R1MCE2_9LACO|nr:hypothetical protein [Liquorilactobacillus oeni]KRL05901.1 hypothetical protein FD46_GL000661 [Liquorilactobacillus oeni DSM 19972]